LIHVPLILRVPGSEGKPVSGNPFSLLHLAPTLLAAADLPVPNEFQGRSKWKQIQEGTPWSEPAISECVVGCTNPFRPEQRIGARILAVRESRYKLVVSFDTGRESLFDLETDRAEKKPLPPAVAKPERRRLLQTALAHLRTSSARQPSEAYLRTRLREISQAFTSNPEASKEIAVG
jgi:arylsulfatase A-like enzyme